MAKLSKVMNKRDLRALVEYALDPDGGFGDIVADIFNSTNPGYPQLDEPPDEVIDAVIAWIGSAEVDSEE